MEDIPKYTLMQAREGDMAAFEEVYRAMSDYVYNIAYRIANNREEAQEVAQDVFLKIYRSLKNFRFRSSFKTWVYRITVNTALNAYKRGLKESSSRINYCDGIGQRGRHETIRDTLDKKNNEELLKSMLDILNPDQRACVVLRDIEGLSYKEIADALNTNINTVRSRLKRARETLIALRQKKG